MASPVLETKLHVPRRRGGLVPRPRFVERLDRGAAAEILEIHIGLTLSIPGGLFELVVGLWLMTRGFQPEAYGGCASTVVTSTVRRARATP